MTQPPFLPLHREEMVTAASST